MLAQPKLTKELKIFLRGFPVAEKRTCQGDDLLVAIPESPSRHQQTHTSHTPIAIHAIALPCQATHLTTG